jgi:hypothetical protein
MDAINQGGEESAAVVEITKKGNLYSAHVRSVHPKGPYDSPYPMSAKALYAELRARGISSIDIDDAFTMCDPDTFKNNPDL